MAVRIVAAAAATHKHAGRAQGFHDALIHVGLFRRRRRLMMPVLPVVVVVVIVWQGGRRGSSARREQRNAVVASTNRDGDLLFEVGDG